MYCFVVPIFQLLTIKHYLYVESGKERKEIKWAHKYMLNLVEIQNPCSLGVILPNISWSSNNGCQLGAE